MTDLMEREPRTVDTGDWPLPGDRAHETSLIRPLRVGHATFETPDLEKAIAYYTEIMGLHLAVREKDNASLATKTGLLVVQLERGAQARCTKISFEVSRHADFTDMARQLADEGIKSEVRGDAVPGMPKVLAFQDPKGTTVELFQEWSYLGHHLQVIGAGPLKLGHIAFCVHDVLEIARFYSRVMGFRVSDWIGDFFVFMRCGPDHHTVNFITGKSVKMHHIAFELKDFMHLQNASDLMGQKRVPIIWGPLRHGPGHNLATYHRNQDDQVIEFFAELDLMKSEELGYFEPRPWHRDFPQRPKVWDPHGTSVWGPPPTPDFLRNRD